MTNEIIPNSHAPFSDLAGIRAFCADLPILELITKNINK
jgi:hypothetical protein